MNNKRKMKKKMIVLSLNAKYQNFWFRSFNSANAEHSSTIQNASHF
jgi:hypothetical protein